MIISQLINAGSEMLRQKNISTHILDSELILSSVLRETRENIIISSKKKVAQKDISNFNKLIKRRLKHEPLAYIFNKKEFWSKNFIIDNNTLIPRPETELLVEKLIKYFKNKKVFMLDLGTGSGCIILSLLSEIKKSRGIGLDISKKALMIAYKNSSQLGLNDRVKFFSRSLHQINNYKFDLIVSNPPYICSHQIKNLADDVKKYEPRIALDGGNDGLDVIKKVIYKSKNVLKIKGMLALEIGYGQFKKVSQILKLQGFRTKFLIKDYRNNIRCIITTLEN
jgi:release factor glutamine methyltransferase